MDDRGHDQMNMTPLFQHAFWVYEFIVSHRTWTDISTRSPHFPSANIINKVNCSLSTPSLQSSYFTYYRLYIVLIYGLDMIAKTLLRNQYFYSIVNKTVWCVLGPALSKVKIAIPMNGFVKYDKKLHAQIQSKFYKCHQIIYRSENYR